jgi:uncharacterized protein YfaS (alpha-2-macroglobulin family)
VSFDKEIYKPGEEVKILIEAHDNLSGIRNMVLYINNPKGRYITFVGARYDDKKNKWIATFPLDEYTMSGTWKVDRINLYDHAHNNAQYYIDSDYQGTFIVENSVEEDTEPPELTKVSFDKEIYKPGEEVKIFIEAHDNLSGIRNMVLYINNPEGRYITFIGARYDEKINKWIATFPLDENIMSGTWKVHRITLFDHAQNNKSYHIESDYQGEFIVEYENYNVGGSVSKVTITPNSSNLLKVGSLIGITATSEGSENPEYRFYIRDEKGSLTTLQEYSSKDTVKWTPTEAGTYRVIVHAKDKSKSGVNFFHEVRTEMIYRIEEPKVTNVNVSPDKTTPQSVGNTITFKAQSEGSLNPEYRFYVRNEKGNLITLQEYSSEDTVNWTPIEAGTYRIIVHAKDKSKPRDGFFHEARTEIVNRIEVSKVTNVSISADKTSPQSIESKVIFKAV